MPYCANCLDKDETILDLADRLAAASEVLGELAKRERAWFSPHCLKEKTLFD